MADQRQIGFFPGQKVARAIEAEQKRLRAQRPKGKPAFVGRAEAVRSLILKAEEMTDAT